MEQLAEVEKLKLRLARSGLQMPLETIKRGMYLPEREPPATENPKKYLRGDEFLMENPFKK